MPYAPDLNPEWGYLASPSVMRTTRLIVLATVIGAIAGAVIVFSLLDQPVADESVAARTLVPEPNRPVTNSTSIEVQQPTEPQQVKPPEAVQKEQKVPPAPAPARRAPPLPSELATTSTPQLSTSVGGFTAEAPAVKESPSFPTFNDTVTIAADPTPPKPQSDKPRMTARSRIHASRYVGRRYDRHFDGPRYGYDPAYGHEPYGSRRSFAWEQY